MSEPYVRAYIQPYIQVLIDEVSADLSLNFFDGVYFSEVQIVALLDAVTEGRTTDARVLDGDGNYVLRFGPRENLCVDRNLSNLTAGVNTIVTPMPLEVDPFGNTGTVYRVQNPATGSTALSLVDASASGTSHGVSVYVKKFSETDTGFTFQLQSNVSPLFNATDNWERAEHEGDTSVGSAGIFLNNAPDSFASDILVCLPQVELDRVTPYIETKGVAVTVPAEPAQANGHGLDGFDELDNYVKESRGILGAGSNPTPAPVASPMITPFKDTGAWTWAVGTNGSKRQTNSTVPAVAGVISYSFIAIVGGAGAQVRDAEGTGLAGGDRDPFTFDFDTMMTLTGRGPDVVQTLSPNRHRLIFFYTNTGAETTAVSILHPFVNATKDNVSFDQFQWTLGEFVPPVIVTTGVAGTRGADDTRVVQGLGPELITGDRDDFTTARTTLVDGATITADQLGTADLLDMSANVNARALYRPGNTLEANVTVRLPVLLQAVSGSGLYPLAGFNGSAVQDSKLVFLTDGEFSLHHVEVTPTSSTDQAGIYIGNRQNVSGETLFAAYVKQVSMKAVTIAPGVGPNPNELTFRVDWDGVAIDTGASRYLFSARNAAGTPRRAPLLLSSSNALLWGGDGSGVFQALNAGPGFDDGGPHTAVCYLNQTTSLFKMSVDGGVTLSGTLAGAVPPNLQELVINQAANFSDASLNGTNTRFDFFEGDLFDQWRT